MKNYNIDLLNDRLKEQIQALKELKQKNPEEAKKEAKEALQRSGILDDSGNLKPPYNGERVNPTDFTRGPRANHEGINLASLCNILVNQEQSLIPEKEAQIWNLSSRSCEACSNPSCCVETSKNTDLDECSNLQGRPCIGRKNNPNIGKCKTLKLTKL